MVAGWNSRCRHEAAVAALLRHHLPRALADRIRVADARGPELELAAQAGAIAAVVRQRTPTLLAELQREGLEFTGIRIRVQVRQEPPPARKVLTNPIDRDAVRPLVGLARDLPEGPLKAALTRLLRRVG